MLIECLIPNVLELKNTYTTDQPERALLAHQRRLIRSSPVSLAFALTFALAFPPRE